MKIRSTKLNGLLKIDPVCFHDERGFFLETYHKKRYHSNKIFDEFVQENHSRSIRGVLRGLHYQIKKPQAQLVTIMHGSIYYVCVDVRQHSNTFGLWSGIELSDKSLRQIYMPPGIAGGFCVLSDIADIHYNVSHLFDPTDEGGVLWSDPNLNIDWPVSNPIITKRDSEFLNLNDIGSENLPFKNI
jgi:dTDP-4-dehydrorhamnose 3,5-epimerase